MWLILSNHLVPETSTFNQCYLIIHLIQISVVEQKWQGGGLVLLTMLALNLLHQLKWDILLHACVGTFMKYASIGYVFFPVHASYIKKKTMVRKRTMWIHDCHARTRQGLKPALLGLWYVVSTPSWQQRIICQS